MEPGEVFTVSLEGIGGSIPLGKANATGDGNEGGFEEVFIIPEYTSPSSYAVRTATDQGEKADVDLAGDGPD